MASSMPLGQAPLRAAQTVPAKTVDDLFLHAQHQFLDTLADHDRTQFSQCASIEELLANIKQYEGFSKRKRRISASLAKLKVFGDNLGPYFKVVEIICGAHPEWANIALGALRLVLQVDLIATDRFVRMGLTIAAVEPLH